MNDAARPGLFDPTLKEVRCPKCKRLLMRWKAVDGKAEVLCTRCKTPVVARTAEPLPVALPPDAFRSSRKGAVG